VIVCASVLGVADDMGNLSNGGSWTVRRIVRALSGQRS
jgi:hypothetical protein